MNILNKYIYVLENHEGHDVPVVGSESEINDLIDIRKKLISEGYMEGHARTREADDSKGKRKEYMHLYLTIKGAIFLDELKDKLHKKSITQYLPAIAVGFILSITTVLVNEGVRHLFTEKPRSNVFHVKADCTPNDHYHNEKKPTPNLRENKSEEIIMPISKDNVISNPTLNQTTSYGVQSSLGNPK
jgi:hypothetical protein